MWIDGDQSGQFAAVLDLTPTPLQAIAGAESMRKMFDLVREDPHANRAP